MIAAVTLAVAVDLHPLLSRAGLFPVGFARLAVIVTVDEIVAGVVGRINVEALDLFTVGGEEALERFEIFLPR